MNVAMTRADTAHAWPSTARWSIPADYLAAAREEITAAVRDLLTVVSGVHG